MDRLANAANIARDVGAVDELSITTLVDNYVDTWLVPQDGVKRFPLSWGRQGLFLLSEHGLALLVETIAGGERREFLLDAGATDNVLAHNAALLGRDLSSADAIIVSHGHPDHVGGMPRLLELVAAKRRIPLYAHPDAFLDRWMVMTSDERHPVIHVDREAWEKLGADIYLETGPRKLDEGVWLTGQIPRMNDFEKGMGSLVRYHDPSSGEDLLDALRDDQALVVNVKGKGPVVIAGCCHAGVINTIEYVQQLSGTDHVYGVFGGFHLSHPTPAATVQRTIEELARLAPTVVSPTHCTGFASIRAIAERMPGAFLLGAVGTTVTIKSPSRA